MPTDADTGDHDGHQRTTIFCLECWLEVWKYNMDSCCLNKQSYALPLWRSNISPATLPVSLPPAMKIQVFHWVPLQSVDLLLLRSSISLATPPVSSSPVQKYNPAHSFMQTLISSSQTFWEGGWGEGGGSNKIKQHVSCDQTTKNIQAGQHNLHQTLNILFTLAMK